MLIHQLILSPNSTLTIKNLKLAASLSGVSNLLIKNCEITYLSLEVDGGGSMEISGFKVSELRIGVNSMIIDGAEIIEGMTQRVAIEGMDKVQIMNTLISNVTS